jgi:hypothetical protein
MRCLLCEGILVTDTGTPKGVARSHAQPTRATVITRCVV